MKQAAINEVFLAVVKRDLLLTVRHPGEAINPLLFFLMVVSMVPLGLSPNPQTLSLVAPGILWVMALLASLLSVDGLFQKDYHEGVLEQMIISPQPLAVIVLAKVLAHWLATGLPLTLTAPLLGMMLSLPVAGFLPLLIGLSMGTALFSLIGAIGSSLTVALRKGGLLLSLLVMPLYVPVLIFGAASVQRTIDGFSASGPLALLGAMLALAIILAPFAASAGLKVGIQS